MIKQILSTVVAATICATAFGQNVPFNTSSSVPLKAPTFHRTVPTVDANGNASGNVELGEKCLQKSRTETLKATNPQYRQGWEAAREMTRKMVSEIESGDRATAPVYTIPVVFHVIHKGESVGSVTNISTAQIESAIDALNRDFRRTSADGGIGQGAGPDTEIQFCLAGVAPNGNPHSGINRVSGTSVSGYSANGITENNESAVKALSRWDNRYYLNVWVVSEIDDNGADASNVNNFWGGTIGYAYHPTSPVTWNSDLDGVVILNLSVGNDPNGSQGYRLWGPGRTNRTLTHEVGHFLGLFHTFEGNSCSAESNCNTQGDEVCDTPPTQQGSDCNSPSCTNTQVENYMDYTSETCQDQFTTGQSNLMRGVISGTRNALVNTNNCGVSTNFDAAVSTISAPSGSLCQTSFTPVVTLNNYGSTTLTSVQIQYYVDSQTPSTYNWTGNLGSNSSTTVTLNSVTTTAGAHTFTARTVSGTLNGSNNDEVTSNDQTTDNFNAGSGGTGVTLTLNVDCWGSEVTWEVKDISNATVASGGPYTNNASGEQFIETFCLPQGCYDFNIFDSEEDGMYGSQWQNCSTDGNYTISDGNTTLVQMTAPNADFGASATHNFCIGGGGSTVICDDLMGFDGSGIFSNPTDQSDFDYAFTDVDGEALDPILVNAGYDSDWIFFYESAFPGDTNRFVGVTSWFANTTVQADNWFTFGPVTMLSDDGEIRWKHRMSSNTYRDGYEVLVGTTGLTVADFNSATALYQVADNAASTDGDTLWTQQSVSLPAGTYANQPLYFAFHHNAFYQEIIYFDDIFVEGCNSITVNISEEEQFNLNIYPNPSSHNFTFQYQSDSSDQLDFRMLNSLGQEVWNHQSNGSRNGTKVIETQGLSTGVYTLVVKGDRLNVSKRLILTK